MTRLWLCWVCWFRTLFDAEFARRALELVNAPDGADVRALPNESPTPNDSRADPHRPTPLASAAWNESTDADAVRHATDGALQLLSLLQREGRLVDFLQQDVASFPDADVGAAARVVHEGCRRALRTHASIESVRTEAEGASVTVDGTGRGELKLTGNVSGKAPYRGVLRHRGWRVAALKLPTVVGEQDSSVVAPAEVEL